MLKFALIFVDAVSFRPQHTCTNKAAKHIKKMKRAVAKGSHHLTGDHDVACPHKVKHHKIRRFSLD